MLLATEAPHKAKNIGLHKKYDRQLCKLPIKIEENLEVTPEIVKKLQPEVIILATVWNP
jgi:hypothetical protein